MKRRIRSTTILAVRRDGKLAIAGDGQVTLDKTIVKHGARKVRRVADGKALAGFAGSRNLRRSSASTKTSSERRSSWRRTGAKIARCAGSKR
jgi:hypothetical protein